MTESDRTAEAWMRRWQVGQRGNPTVRGNEARKEGWDIFDCSGSEYGRWQISRVDKAEGGDVQLDSDDDAWRIVFEGKEARHRLAREFIRDHNPVEWKTWCRHAARLNVNMSKLEPALVAEITAEVLSC
jgi:hypothetical protein